VFFSLVFLLGRHAHWDAHLMYEEVRHPFDPHPVGIHRTGGSPAATQQDSSKTSQPASTKPTQQNPAPAKAAGSEQKSATPVSKANAPTAVVSKPDAAAGGQKGKEDDGLTQLDRDYKPTRWILRQGVPYQ
jgi:hypothetical protein